MVKLNSGNRKDINPAVKMVIDALENSNLINVDRDLYWDIWIAIEKHGYSVW